MLGGSSPPEDKSRAAEDTKGRGRPSVAPIPMCAHGQMGDRDDIKHHQSVPSNRHHPPLLHHPEVLGSDVTGPRTMTQLYVSSIRLESQETIVISALASFQPCHLTHRRYDTWFQPFNHATLPTAGVTHGSNHSTMPPYPLPV